MNIEELLTNRNIAYKISGRDFVVRCFNKEHDDNNPSLRIDQYTGMMHCFSCGFKGDVFAHFGEKVSKNFKAVHFLKEKISKLLVKNPIMPKGAIPFALSYRNISPATYLKFKAFTQSTNPDFVDRLVIPVTDINNKLVGFIGRYMHTNVDPKYKIVPAVKLPLYPSKVHAIENSIIVVEGMFDMLNLHDKGLTNVVTGFGISRGQLPTWKTNKRRKEKIQEVIEDFSIYKLQGISKIYIMFDGDEAGKLAAQGLVECLKHEFSVDTIDLRDGEDPGDFTTERVNALRSLLYENSSSGQVSN